MEGIKRLWGDSMNINVSNVRYPWKVSIWEKLDKIKSYLLHLYYLVDLHIDNKIVMCQKDTSFNEYECFKYKVSKWDELDKIKFCLLDLYCLVDFHIINKRVMY